jgi:hypothetical protein
MRTAQGKVLRSNHEDRLQHKNGASAIRVPGQRCRTLRGRCRRRRRGAALSRRRRSPSSGPGQAAAADSPPRGRGAADRGPWRECWRPHHRESDMDAGGARRRRRGGAASRRRRRGGGFPAAARATLGRERAAPPRGRAAARAEADASGEERRRGGGGRAGCGMGGFRMVGEEAGRTGDRRCGLWEDPACPPVCGKLEQWWRRGQIGVIFLNDHGQNCNFMQ